MLTIYFDSGLISRHRCLINQVDWFLKMYEEVCIEKELDDKFNSFKYESNTSGAQ